MALDYELEIACDIDSDNLLRIVEDSLGIDHYRDPHFRSEHNPSLVGRWTPWFLLTASKTDQRCGEISEEWLGFRPTVHLGFRLTKDDEERDRAYQLMLRATSAVLVGVVGDAALAFNGETGILIRRDGRVTLTTEPLTFYPEALAEIRMPYQFGRVPTAADAPGP